MESKVNIKLLSMLGQGGSTFGVALMRLMEERNDIMVLSADMSSPAGLDKFKAAYPDNFINVGIAEQNMIGIAAGLANEGYKVVCVAQAAFITMRCFEQVRQFVGHMGYPIILIGIASGFSLQFFGSTHYALEDIALMSTLPNMTIMAPCDSLEAMKAIEYAVDNDTPAYIRFFGGTGIPSVHKQDFDFCPEPITLRQGDDATIIATGSMVAPALQAARILESHEIECEVLNMPVVKPFDETALTSCANKRLIVSVEEHNDVGGLGTAISASIVRNSISVPHLRITAGNNYLKTVGSYGFMLKQCGLDAESIATKIASKLKGLK